MQPCLLALCERHGEEKIKRAAVMTAVVQINPSQALFVTCKHAIKDHTKLFFVDETGAMSMEKWTIFHHPGSDVDLSFALIPRSIPPGQIKVSESPINPGTVLSHARNRLEKEESSPFTIHTATARNLPIQAVINLVDPEWTKFTLSTDEEGFRTAKSLGVRPLYRVLEMESWPGVSGSALWDKYGSIRGIVCGGSMRAEETRRLIYLPAKTVMRETRLVLAQPEVRAQIKC